LEVIISVAEQKLALVKDGEIISKFPVSTSKFGVGDGLGSYKTPLGRRRGCEKIGDNLPAGAVMKGRNPTGEILAANAQGRDPIVTRLLWLEGLDPENRNAHGRCIYIHGTPQESRIGKPASYGCVRMRSMDVIQVFAAVPAGTVVTITKDRLPHKSVLAALRTLHAGGSQG
jgi:lipoprotein-anchoring transpeptidase ErfK/SrfK